MEISKILESIADGFFFLDPHWNFIYINERAANFWKKVPSQLLGKNIWEDIPQAVGTIFDEQYRRALSEQNPVSFEAISPLTRSWVAVRAYPSSDGLSVYFTDISERKRSEMALAAAKDQLAADLDAMTRLQSLAAVFVREGDMREVLDKIVETAIAITNADMGNIQLLDKQSGCLKVMAHRGFEQPFLDFWNSVAEGQGACGTALKQAERVIIEDVTQSPIFVGTPALDVQMAAGVRAVQSTPLVSRSGKPLGMFSTHFRSPHRPDERSLRLLDLLTRQAADIIERAQIEEELRASEEQLRTLADTIPNLAWWANGDGYITWYNRRWYEYTGTTPEQMEGWGWQSVHDPEVLPKVLERWKASIATGEPFEMEFPLLGADGVFHPFLTRVMPLKDAAGQVLRWFGTNTDISAQKRAEGDILKLSNDLAAQNIELEAFIYSVSHDLRAPLRTISGFIKILGEDYTEQFDDQGRDYMNRVYKSSEKMSKLIEELLYLSHVSRQEVNRIEFSISSKASSIIDVLRETDPGRIVEVSVEEGLTSFADSGLTDVVLSNLLGNAWKFTSKMMNARIEFGAFDRDGKTVYYVKDNGIGFDPNYKEKLFAPFQRLHSDEEFEGTGIGLSIVERIIRRHGGRIWAQGEKGKGATFFFTLS